METLYGSITRGGSYLYQSKERPGPIRKNVGWYTCSIQHVQHITWVFLVPSIYHSFCLQQLVLVHCLSLQHSRHIFNCKSSSACHLVIACLWGAILDGYLSNGRNIGHLWKVLCVETWEGMVGFGMRFIPISPYPFSNLEPWIDGCFLSSFGPLKFGVCYIRD